ncbi:MAG: hypothetical protein D6770_02945 [Anaerolineae bacterium]|nr:MAG: hypothetical protein D6770_02945 [Anaerolineae bacterium]
MATLYGSIGGRSREKMMAAKPSTAEQVKGYLGKVAAHVPSEVITIYLLGKAIASGNKGMLGFWAVACWAIALFLRWFGTQGEGRMLNVLLTTLAFPIWVMAIGGTILGFTLGEQAATLAALAFAVVGGALYNAD